jgi:branched-chain amino acid transport system permease protein
MLALRHHWPAAAQVESDLAYATIVGLEIVYSIATLILVSLGLAIIFGMMRVINFAHGEFLVMGGYAATVAVHHGINFWISIIVIPPIVIGIIGVAIERTIIRFLYGRMFETMLATWGLSLFLVGLLTTIFGDDTEGVPMAMPGVRIGAYQVSSYNFFIIGFSIVLLGAVFVFLRYTRFGLVARAVMQNPAMAGALGTNTSAVYASTFAFGAALAGLAGGVIAPIAGVVPTTGSSYIGQAFITVLGGGASALAGVISAAILFGVVDQAATFSTNAVLGEVALFVAAIILIRMLPNGITGRFFKGSV